MTQSTDIFVSWTQYYALIESLAVKIYQAEWTFNQIVCLARGGLRIGDVLSRIYNQPLAILAASSYGGEAYQTRGPIRVSQTLTMSEPTLGDRILLVDDLVDSGATLISTVQWLREHHGVQPEHCRTAVLWYKDCSRVAPDYFVQQLPNSPWIHQPFEVYENQALQGLIDRFQRTGSMVQKDALIN